MRAYLLLTMLLIAGASYAQLGESEHEPEGTHCQYAIPVTGNFSNIRLLTQVMQNQIKTYDYSSPANTEFLYLNGEKIFAWKNHDASGTVILIKIADNGMTMSYRGTPLPGGQFNWVETPAAQLIIDSTDGRSQFRHVVKAGKLFECSRLDMTKCQVINSSANVREENFVIAKPGKLYDYRGQPRGQTPRIQSPPQFQRQAPRAQLPPQVQQQAPRYLTPNQSRPRVQLQTPSENRRQLQSPRPQVQPRMRHNHPDPNVGRPKVTKNPIPEDMNEISWLQLKEVNYARTNPHGYAKVLQNDIKRGVVPRGMLQDYKITINVLLRRDARGIKPLFPSRELSRRAQSWSANQARWGMRHSSRMYGTRWAENVTQFGRNPRFAVVAYIGETNNIGSNPIGHRLNIFSTSYHFIGIGTVGGYSTQQFSNRP